MGVWEFAIWVALWAAILAKPGSIDPIMPVVLGPFEFFIIWVGLGVWALLMFLYRNPKKP
ncbi:hypothetical protein LCGC14_0338090 [marine sediment metagenome]|uniref:Uncharacterized protein n=1 Tax=marine sediment metagenome TaxID=412755 RepID=A0A0F9TEG0_9ZZZZ